MNLGKLLGVGKSFFGSDPMAAYQLNKRVHLPKFNEGKNPFASKPPPSPAETIPATAQVEVKASVPAVPAAPKAPPPYAFKPETQPVSQPATPAAVGTKPARPAWTTRLNPFRAPEPEPEPLAVQEELSLDAVKVVHNDLADADVEMVPAKSRADATPVLQPPRQAWEYMGENLLNHG